MFTHIATARRRRIAGLAVVASVGVLTAGCGKGQTVKEPFADAPRSSTTNDSPGDIVLMPDGFSNVATKCDHGNRIYTIYHKDLPYGSISVVPNDPTCAGKK
ncbi:hypothetical protein LO772_01915 [Yinghuangia sp. ASG 101]|uniref:hypothetical protein n=1 Tax=Yinghuangia sp. ASG 101 TaxID=2896848 RepID=UPI001E32A8D5|nr:hypothetical protein [Yinghuangia sp. ASG 101]UGQ12393.1 hypothetical protein LO772_01915 [Yinghuangia sp. ASG 101]